MWPVTMAAHVARVTKHHTAVVSDSNTQYTIYCESLDTTGANSFKTERQFSMWRKQAEHTEVKNASLVFVRYVTHCITGNAALFLPSYVFYVHLSLSGL